ncbi:hypothetical protein [Thauera linaloolentis]|uniref:Uncharacterized protein n=1 Tax=Thauera linaloolentis (strain DSM 12138 / JCM 21573 / CCUG 41526 / CIP 105981 / IAM 15112 / NBRC 102519 / 47Lol) TaxID=1123367 RepID=N6Z6P0_THAL4|nr:hypothetical protein [Thauera linaloolentis]ENO90217.1 hypothetical protein C666_02095 [Thauera linaloolentis 47Lol = DSM 12138]MCM8566292.1 hypothetical protein [Thauera linaloolentis]
MTMIKPGKQSFLVLAQDPGMTGSAGERVFAMVDIPAERLSPGPTGYRVKVVDFDAEAGVLYKAHSYQEDAEGRLVDAFSDQLQPAGSTLRKQSEDQLLANPMFHGQNVYALVMRTLARFEYALGRRVHWGFDGHQLHVAPHAFIDANAFYSREDRALMFGYFSAEHEPGHFVFTCLSHDIVVHETTHALLDGLREGFMNFSGPDQAAFHEGFSDVVALLSVFSFKEVVELALTRFKDGAGGVAIKSKGRSLIHRRALTASALADGALMGLAEEFGRALGGMRANALRRSVRIKPSRNLLHTPEFSEPHTRGEILAAAVMRTFLQIWLQRIEELGTFDDGYYNLTEVAAEGAKVADHLLTMSIRALDYCPPLDLEFGDYLAALLTADAEIAPDDKRYHYRDTVSKVFGSFGIEPPASRTDKRGCWTGFTQHPFIQYRRTNFESMLRDPEEVFRFIWENRDVLGVDERSYTQVVSVRPSIRIGPEGFLLRETICEYISRANIFGAELGTVCNVNPRPSGVDSNTALTVYGAGTLVFDQYGQLKYHIARQMNDGDWQRKRLEYLFGEPLEDNEVGNAFANLHRMRAHCASCNEQGKGSRASSKARTKGTQPASPPAGKRGGPA